MSDFITAILTGDLEELLGVNLYAETISKIVVWWSVLPMVGIIIAFSALLLGLFGRSRK